METDREKERLETSSALDGWRLNAKERTIHEVVSHYKIFENGDLSSAVYSYSYYSIRLPNTGFPRKDASFPKFKNISNLLSDDKEGKIM